MAQAKPFPVAASDQVLCKEHQRKLLHAQKERWMAQRAAALRAEATPDAAVAAPPAATDADDDDLSMPPEMEEFLSELLHDGQSTFMENR